MAISIRIFSIREIWLAECLKTGARCFVSCISSYMLQWVSKNYDSRNIAQNYWYLRLILLPKKCGITVCRTIIYCPQIIQLLLYYTVIHWKIIFLATIMVLSNFHILLEIKNPELCGIDGLSNLISEILRINPKYQTRIGLSISELPISTKYW